MGWEYSSVVEQLPSVCKALDLLPSTEKNKASSFLLSYECLKRWLGQPPFKTSVMVLSQVASPPPLPDGYSSSLFPFSHGDKMEAHMLTTHTRYFKSGRLPSFLSNVVRLLCRAVFLKWIRWVFQSKRKSEDEINKSREEIERGGGGGTYVFRWYFKIDGELMRQRYWKLTPDGENSNGRLVWRDRTQAGTRQGEEATEEGERSPGKQAVGGGGLRVFEVVQKNTRIVESTALPFSLIILLSRLMAHNRPFLLWYAYEKGRFISLWQLC